MSTPIINVPEAKSWMADAACLDVPPDVFFPSTGGPQNHARQVCHDCPVKVACLAYALECEGDSVVELRHGIYGGLNPNERVALAGGRQRNRP